MPSRLRCGWLIPSASGRGDRAHTPRDWSGTDGRRARARRATTWPPDPRRVAAPLGSAPRAHRRARGRYLVRPARLLRGRLDQLDGDAHAAAIDANTAFDQVRDTKLSCDGWAIGVAKPILGQNPRPLHEKGTKRSSPQPAHRNRAKPFASTPHLRNSRNSRSTNDGTSAPSRRRAASVRNVSKCSSTIRYRTPSPARRGSSRHRGVGHAPRQRRKACQTTGRVNSE